MFIPLFFVYLFYYISGLIFFVLIHMVVTLAYVVLGLVLSLKIGCWPTSGLLSTSAMKTQTASCLKLFPNWMFLNLWWPKWRAWNPKLFQWNPNLGSWKPSTVSCPLTTPRSRKLWKLSAILPWGLLLQVRLGTFLLGPQWRNPVVLPLLHWAHPSSLGPSLVPWAPLPQKGRSQWRRKISPRKGAFLG